MCHRNGLKIEFENNPDGSSLKPGGDIYCPEYHRGGDQLPLLASINVQRAIDVFFRDDRISSRLVHAWLSLASKGQGRIILIAASILHDESPDLPRMALGATAQTASVSMDMLSYGER